MVSNKLKCIRLKRGISISELSRRTGLSRVTITNIEQEKSLPTLLTALLIARELEVSVTHIFFIHDVNHELQCEVSEC